MTWHSTANLLHKYETLKNAPRIASAQGMHLDYDQGSKTRLSIGLALLRLWTDMSTMLFQLSLGQTWQHVGPDPRDHHPRVCDHLVHQGSLKA